MKNIRRYVLAAAVAGSAIAGLSAPPAQAACAPPVETQPAGLGVCASFVGDCATARVYHRTPLLGSGSTGVQHCI